MRARLVLLALLALLSGDVAHADAPAPAMSADAALKVLLAGNQGFASAGGACPRQTAARRSSVATSQHPVAVVIGCADSRVPPEAVFGQGIGDLFVIRVAGNVIDDEVLGSVEYAVEHLGVPLVVVLGHERCGAVQAALAKEAPQAHVAALVTRIRAALAAAPKATGGDPVDHAVSANVAASVKQVQASEPVLAPLVRSGKVKVVGARYDLDTGAVQLLP